MTASCFAAPLLAAARTSEKGGYSVCKADWVQLQCVL